MLFLLLLDVGFCCCLFSYLSFPFWMSFYFVFLVLEDFLVVVGFCVFFEKELKVR